MCPPLPLMRSQLESLCPLHKTANSKAQRLSLQLHVEDKWRKRNKRRGQVGTWDSCMPLSVQLWRRTAPHALWASMEIRSKWLHGGIKPEQSVTDCAWTSTLSFGIGIMKKCHDGWTSSHYDTYLMTFYLLAVFFSVVRVQFKSRLRLFPVNNRSERRGSRVGWESHGK